MKILFSLFLIIVLLSIESKADEKKSLIREGNKLFKEEKFNESEIKYRKAQEIEYGYKSTFNLGDALYKQGNFEEAALKFKELSGQNLDKKTLASANHNLGNSLLKSGKYEESINAYKNALKLNPTDDDTRYNLEMAKRMLKMQEQNKQNQDKNQDNQDKQEGDKQQNDQQKDKGQDKDKNQNEQQEKDKQQDDKGQGGEGQEKPTDKNSQQSNKPRPQEISKEDASRILNALQNEEKDLQKKLRKQKGERTKIERNW